MALCASCKQEIVEDPNQIERVVECRYCDAVFCSAECASDHEQRAHPEEAVPPAEEEEERRR